MNAVKADKNWALAGTTTFHLVIVFLLLLLMKTCGSGSGNGQGNGVGDGYMELNVAALGTPEDGFGEPSPPASSQSEAQPEESVPDESALTEESSEVSLPEKTDKPKPDKPVTKPTEKPQEVSNPLNNALDKLGDKGNPSGDKPGDNNTGVPGGLITGKGVLSGNGGGDGSGYEFSFFRNMNVKPSLDEKPKDEGTVVVDVWVDKNGNVVKAQANPSAAKTNTSNSDLYKLAEKAAKNAKFASDSKVTGTQKGTITITFKLV